MLPQLLASLSTVCLHPASLPVSHKYSQLWLHSHHCELYTEQYVMYHYSLLLNDCLQIDHLNAIFIIYITTTCELFAEFTSLGPRSASPCTVNHSCHVHLYLLDCGLQVQLSVYPITASMCITTFIWSNQSRISPKRWLLSPSNPPNLVDFCHQLNTIMHFECIWKLVLW